jgi:uncharacterized membrane protein
MTLRNVLLTAHILTAILTIGWLAMQSMVMPGIIRRGPSAAGFVRASSDVAKKVGPSSVIVFLIGLALVLRQKDDYAEFKHVWVNISMLLFIVTAVIGAVFIGRTEERAAEKLEAGETALDEARTLSILGGISTLLLVTIVYLMVAKPGI